MSDTLLIAQNLSYARGDKPLVRDVSVRIRKASSTVIMGHNGAGKTLSLYMLHGLIAPDSGAIEVANGISQKMVFEKPVLLRRAAGAHFAFASGITDHDATHYWFDKAGLRQKIANYTRSLSSGEQQKLALISAIATKPDLLFLDEPTANLDSESRYEIEQLITTAKQNGTSIIMITHLASQAKRLADDILFLHKGKVQDHVPASAFFSGKQSKEAAAFLAER
ncbi:MAG: ATP-binding cassette domain-containing protein [Candidatus Puniceispirillaceae bacterium]